MSVGGNDLVHRYVAAVGQIGNAGRHRIYFTARMLRRANGDVGPLFVNESKRAK